MNYYKINEEMAKRAKEMNSYSDYKEGEATKEYQAKVDEIKDYAEKIKAKIKNNTETIERIDYLVNKFSKQYADWTNKYYEIECRCPSILITGGSNFPTRKKEKQNNARDTHWGKYNELMKIKDQLSAILHGTNIIKSDDPNAIEKLEKKLIKKQELQQEMKEANTYYRKHKTMKGYKDISDDEAQKLDSEIKSSYSWQQKPYPSYYLSNNNQEIHRIKERISQIKKLKETITEKENLDTIEQTEQKEKENKYFEVVRDTNIMRLQLFFDGKPNENIRNIIKSNGFRWSPRNMCWQRQLTNNAEYSLELIIKALDEINTDQNN